MYENKIDTKDRFNSAKASAYDENITKVIPGYQTLHEIARILLEDFLPGSSKVLISGCGTGKEIMDYSRNNPQWNFLGFDPSEVMLSVTKERVHTGNCEGRVHLVQGVIDDVLETDFDAATSMLVIQFLSNDDAIQGYLNGISARLKRGAPLVMAYLDGDKESKEYSVLNSAWKTQQLATRNNYESVNKEFNQRDKDMRFISKARIELFLKKAGFSKPLRFYQAYLLAGQIAFKE